MSSAKKCDRCGKFFDRQYNTSVELTTSSNANRNVTFDCGLICAETIGSGLVQEYDSSLTMPFSVLNQNKVVPDVRDGWRYEDNGTT